MKRAIIQISAALTAGFLLYGTLPSVFAEEAAAPQEQKLDNSMVGDKLFVSEEKLLIGNGEKHSVELMFTPDKVTVTSNCVKIDRISSRVFEISAVATGSAKLSFSSSDAVKNFYITVTGSNLQVYRELVRAFVNCPEITVERTTSDIILSGTVYTIESWELYKRVMNMKPEGVKDYVIFHPGRRLFDDLKKQLATDGFKVEKTIAPDKPGVVRFSVNDTTLTIDGYFNNNKDIERMKRIISTQKWLNSEWTKNNFRVSMDLMPVDTQVQVSIVFVGVQRKHIREWGNYNANGVLMSWDLAGWLQAMGGTVSSVASSSGGAGSAYLGSTLTGSLKFFAEHNINDYHDAGYVTITNHGPQATYSNGGTINVEVSGMYSGDMDEIDYGTTYKIQGYFVRDNVIHLDLDLERNLEPVKVGQDYDQKKMNAKTSLNCPIGSTAIIAGQVNRSHEVEGPTGYGIFRNIPIINWVLANGKYDTEDDTYLILVYPEIVNPDKIKIEQKPIDLTKDTEKTAAGTIFPVVNKIRKDEQKKWYQKMFTW